MIIVTRPSPEGNILTQDLKNNHIPAQHLPLFNIEPGQDLPRLQHELNQLNKGDYVIVVSPQVSHILKSKAISFKPPHHLFYFAVGKKSAELFSQLLNKKIKYPKIEVTYPEQENSEGLLQLLDSKPLKNKNILILRGNSGRELLAETLTKQQAKVKWIECYARKPILYSPADFLVDIHQQMIIITSIENLLQLEYYKLNENKKSATLIVTSLRIAEQAKILGWQNIELSDGANNKILFKTIESLCNNDK